MRASSMIDELDSLHEDNNALDQSIALNRIVMTMLESKRREDFWLRIILIVSILVNVAIASIFIWYESQWEYTTTATTVTQDTGEGSGNNVYQAGENAEYIQGDSKEVTSDGEASYSYQDNYQDESLN